MKMGSICIILPVIQRHLYSKCIKECIEVNLLIKYIDILYQNLKTSKKNYFQNFVFRECPAHIENC